MKIAASTQSTGAAVLALLFSSQTVPAQSVPVTTRAERIAVVQRVMETQEKRFEERVQADPPSQGTRDLPNAALILLRANAPSSRAENLLQRVFDVQNMDPASPDYGTVPWKFADPSVRDANAIEFTMQPFGALLLQYGDKLSPAFHQTMEPHLRAALVAEAHHAVKVSYTNIFLMNTVNTLLLAQYLHDDVSWARGISQWKQWMAYSAQAALHEFNSPTYYATDLADLTYAILYVRDPTVRRQMQEAAALIWTDITANYLAGAHHLAGAHSRDYQFLAGRGSLEVNLFVEGLAPTPADGFPDLYLEKVAVLENERPGGFHPAPAMIEETKLPVRTLRARYDLQPGRTRTSYLTQSFAMGTANGSYESQDKMFAVDLVGPSPVPTIIVTPDAFDNPYGLHKTRDPGGHDKPHHLPPNLSSVQEDGLALLVFDLDPREASEGQDFVTNLVLPANPDSFLLDGRAIKLSASTRETASPSSVVGLRIRTSCFAARIFAVDPLDGRAATVSLQGDREGWENGAVRLVIQHSSTLVSKSEGQRHLHVGILADVEPCAAASGSGGVIALTNKLRAAQTSGQADAATFRARAEVTGHRLALVEDLKTRLPSSQQIDGTDVPTPFYQLNGKDVPIFDTATGAPGR